MPPSPCCARLSNWASTTSIPATFTGPHVTNQLINRALHPYPDNLHIVTKAGALRGDDKSWNPALSPDQLTEAVHSNLRNLGLESLDVVNLRLGDP